MSAEPRRLVLNCVFEDCSEWPSRSSAPEGRFRLKPISKPRGWPDVMTVFLRSFAENWNGKLVAVVVSGYDGDGAYALCAIPQSWGRHDRPET